MSMILNLETATTNCSVSLAKDGKTIAIKEHDTPNYSHSEQLHVFIQEVISKALVSLADLDAVAVSKGPGSYTGLRIGVSAAKGLCFSLDIPLISVPTLEILANSVSVDGFDFIIPLLDARRMEVYAAVYDSNLQEIRETKAEIIDADSFASYVSKGKTVLVGNGASKCKDILKHPDFYYEVAAVPSAEQAAQLSFQKFQNRDFENVAYFEPFYLKDFILQQKKA